MFKGNGMLRQPPQSRKPSRPVRMLSATIVAAILTSLPLAACVTTNGSVTDTKAQCAAWREIMMSRKDTKPTQQQVAIHNETGRNLGCW